MNDQQRDPMLLLPEPVLYVLAAISVVMLTILGARWLLRRWRRR